MVYWVSELTEKGKNEFERIIRKSLVENYSCSNEEIESYVVDSIHDKLGNYDAHLSIQEMKYLSSI